jgi:hypothetical protein
MTNTFIHSFQSEWLKRKRSLTSWLVLVGAFFTPFIILISRIKNYDKLSVLNMQDDFWEKLWNQAGESMMIFFLPMGIILATGLITQIEYKNNTWKQLHTTPQRFITIFLSKLLVILVLMIAVFVFYNLALYLSAVIPSLFFAAAPYPQEPIRYSYFLGENLKFFIDSLPILGLQFLISLQFRNFLVPVGVGFVIWMLGIGMVSWQYCYIFPYVYTGIDHFISSGAMPGRQFPAGIQWMAFGYFAAFIIAGYILYAVKKEKG